MTTITWNVHKTKYETSDNFIYEIHYRVNAVDGSLLSSYVDSVKLLRPNTLIPYKDLTESKLLEWIKSKVNSTEIEKILTDDIAKKKTPATGKGLPWVEEES
tara:strand:+ start:309 stop:614 length:306 start_codon:yes stop_codon:yes gene_type:complete